MCVLGDQYRHSWNDKKEPCLTMMLTAGMVAAGCWVYFNSSKVAGIAMFCSIAIILPLGVYLETRKPRETTPEPVPPPAPREPTPQENARSERVQRRMDSMYELMVAHARDLRQQREQESV